MLTVLDSAGDPVQEFALDRKVLYHRDTSPTGHDKGSVKEAG